MWSLRRPMHRKYTVTYQSQYFTINSCISECDHECETQSAEPEIGTDGCSQREVCWVRRLLICSLTHNHGNVMRWLYRCTLTECRLLAVNQLCWVAGWTLKLYSGVNTWAWEWREVGHSWVEFEFCEFFIRLMHNSSLPHDHCMEQ